MTVVWSGTAREAAEWQATVARNCTCRALGYPCPVCVAASTDQRLLDGVVFVLRLRRQLWEQEFRPAEATA